MQKTLTNLTTPKPQNPSQSKLHQLYKRDSLFACKKQKQLVLESLKKGTLFRLSHHLSSEVKLQVKDPFVAWLEEIGGQDVQETGERSREMGETYFYVNKDEVHKQKKLTKPVLPALHKFNSTYTHKRSPFSSNNTQNHSFHLSVSSPKPCNASSSHKQKIAKVKQVSPHLSALPVRPRLNPLKSHKLHCYQQTLNKTQLFPTTPSHSLYQNNQNLIQSQFYLNDHKKKPGIHTFYLKPKTTTEADQDLKRVQGLREKVVNGFDDNLRKLYKESSLSCYDELGAYFSRMKGEMGQLIKNAQVLDKKKKQRKTHTHKRDGKSQQEKSMPQISLNRINTVERDNTQMQRLNNKEGYLPDFLLKSLILPVKRQTLSGQRIHDHMIRG